MTADDREPPALDPSVPLDLAELFGGIDIYLFDQLLKGRIRPGMRVFDAGCGSGRNLVYLMRAGCDVAATDMDPSAVASVVRLAEALAPELPASNFRVDLLEDLDEPPESADVVICSAVLHFARDDAHFRAMLDGAWSILKPGGLFFARLGSTIGASGELRAFGGGRYGLPDGTERYLVDLERLFDETERLGGELLDPIKTTDVQGQRSMTTWVLRKRDRA